MGAGPCAHLPDCNYIHYALQLNTYRFLLEKNYGMEIEGQAIIVLHPNNRGGRYMVYELPDLQDEVRELLGRRRAEVAARTTGGTTGTRRH